MSAELLNVVRVDAQGRAAFREMVEAYWRELMPQSSVVGDRAQGEAYFQSRFSWNGGQGHPYWAIVDGRRIGFMMFRLSDDHKMAQIHDFYVIPHERRKGYGAAMAQWLLSYFDQLGLEQVDLNVRVDNPTALDFWKAQGFEVAGYRLRQYRA